MQLESYVQGTRLQDLPDLKSLVYELKFVPTVERVQEADHSIVHRSVGPSNTRVFGGLTCLVLCGCQRSVL